MVIDNDFIQNLFASSNENCLITAKILRLKRFRVKTVHLQLSICDPEENKENDVSSIM